MAKKVNKNEQKTKKIKPEHIAFISVGIMIVAIIVLIVIIFAGGPTNSGVVDPIAPCC